MSDVTIEYNLNFGNVEYLLYLSLVDDKLKLSLEQLTKSMYWRGEYEAGYIEEVTNKAGSYKTFQVFLKMLKSAFAKESDAVVVDILSYKELEQMKSKRNNSMNESISSTSNFNSTVDFAKINRKYLIMTYSSEFEKVHYPLHLQFMNPPGEEDLLRTIERLKKCKTYSTTQNTNMTINYKEVEELKQENFKLKNAIKLIENQRRPGAVENDEIIRSREAIREEFENYRATAENKIKILVQTIEELKNKLNANNFSISTMSSKNENYVKELENRLEEASKIVISERKQGQSFIDEKIREIERLKKEVLSLKEEDKKSKVRIKQLQNDLDIANKKNLYETNRVSKNITSTPKSTYSYKSNSVKSSYSNTSSKKSATNSTTSNVKKNLQVNPYNKYKGLHNKNYSPFKFFDKKKNSSSSIKSKSVKSSSSIVSSGTKSKQSSIPISKLKPAKVVKAPVNNYMPKTYQSNKFKTGIQSTTNAPKNINSHLNKTVATPYLNPKESLMEEKTKIINRLKIDTNNPSILNGNDINEKLARIQSLLDSAKV